MEINTKFFLKIISGAALAICLFLTIWFFVGGAKSEFFVSDQSSGTSKKPTENVAVKADLPPESAFPQEIGPYKLVKIKKEEEGASNPFNFEGYLISYLSADRLIDVTFRRWRVSSDVLWVMRGERFLNKRGSEEDLFKKESNDFYWWTENDYEIDIRTDKYRPGGQDEQTGGLILLPDADLPMLTSADAVVNFFLTTYAPYQLANPLDQFPKQLGNFERNDQLSEIGMNCYPSQSIDIKVPTCLLEAKIIYLNPNRDFATTVALYKLEGDIRNLDAAQDAQARYFLSEDTEKRFVGKVKPENKAISSSGDFMAEKVIISASKFPSFRSEDEQSLYPTNPVLQYFQKLTI